MPREKFETFVKKTYEEPSLKRREEIVKNYQEIEKKLNGYYEKTISAKELADYLGSVAMGTKQEHPSAQIYAYDCLLRSLSETDKQSKKDIDAITEEAVFDAAVERNPMKRAYLLGILFNRSSNARMNKIQEKIMSGEISSDNTKTQEDIDIISKIRASATRLKNDLRSYPQMDKIINYILEDFPRGENECEAARLIANYYEKEPHATRLPSIGELSIAEDEEIWKGLEGNGIPRYVYTLAPGYHPSQEKLDEADNFGIGLNQRAAFFKDGGTKYVSYDMNPELSRLYNRRIRHYKDTKNYNRVELLENALKERVWRKIQESGDTEAADVFRDREDLLVLRRTIRDYPIDLEMNTIIKEEFQETKEA